MKKRTIRVKQYRRKGRKVKGHTKRVKKKSMWEREKPKRHIIGSVSSEDIPVSLGLDTSFSESPKDRIKAPASFLKIERAKESQKSESPEKMIIKPMSLLSKVERDNLSGRQASLVAKMRGKEREREMQREAASRIKKPVPAERVQKPFVGRLKIVKGKSIHDIRSIPVPKEARMKNIESDIKFAKFLDTLPTIEEGYAEGKRQGKKKWWESD